MPSSTASELSQIISGQRNQPSGSPRKGKGLRYILLGAIVLLVGAGAMRMFSQPAPQTERVFVVGAGKDLPAGYRIGYTSMHMVSLPAKYVTKDMVSSTNLLVGRVTRTFIAQGEPITEEYLLPTKNGLADSVNYSERALTLHLSDDALVDHNIYPGDRVDIVATTTAPRDGRKYTKTICQDVTVLMAVPRESLLSSGISNGDGKNRITLSVSPVDAEKISQGVESGKLRLALRNTKNRIKVQLTGADDRDLLPHSALREEASIVQTSVKATTLPPLPSLAAPPPMALPEPTVEMPQQPLQWVVDVFKGATKEAQTVEKD